MLRATSHAKVKVNLLCIFFFILYCIQHTLNINEVHRPIKWVCPSPLNSHVYIANRMTHRQDSRHEGNTLNQHTGILCCFSLKIDLCVINGIERNYFKYLNIWVCKLLLQTFSMDFFLVYKWKVCSKKIYQSINQWMYNVIKLQTYLSSHWQLFMALRCTTLSYWIVTISYNPSNLVLKLCYRYNWLHNLYYHKESTLFDKKKFI